MASFLLVRDPDPTRRRQALELRQRARRALRGLVRRMGVRDRERRYYYRIFDFDGPAGGRSARR